MWTEGQRLRAEGRREELAEVVLRLLALRGLRVDKQSRQRILKCRSMATLNRWFERALLAKSLSDVLET
ncbi:hypothetical protein BO221_34435 [Archangium sp. Cb G35]|uniref:hypothetical protein n=1 Tax=Archangium sp. Cb G35 TaxID=1920190 RepID=UPI000935AB27|nr:hypothetical protein [Archangium sp. Cb G35]OJT19484.1 hypothetical protein BO221_34435 [Archangium sp. Cb G35]